MAKRHHCWLSISIIEGGDENKGAINKFMQIESQQFEQTGWVASFQGAKLLKYYLETYLLENRK
jgi:hypothetical protein|tara:strand:+ start:317 stop:508 length:192 start_codon:yes stop_codon:yes gene_type:complete